MPQTQTEIENEITYRRTVDAVLGTHEQTGLMMTEYRDIVVRPTDNPGYDPNQHTLTDPEERTWWEDWCNAEGNFRALQATHTAAELDAIAQKAGYVDWADVQQRITDAADDEAIVSIHEEVAAAAA